MENKEGVMSKDNRTQSVVNEIIQNINVKREKIFTQKLNFLIEQGILIIHETQPVFIREGNNKIAVSMALDLKVRDQERLEEMAAEIEFLKEQLSRRGEQ